MDSGTNIKLRKYFMKKLWYGCLILFSCILLIGLLPANQVIDEDDNAPSVTASIDNQDNVPDYAKPKAVAGGNINTDGTIAQGYNIKKVEWNASLKRWQITLKGKAKNYYYSDFLTIVTAIDMDGISATTGSLSNRLNVYLTDITTGDRVKENFSFVVFKI